MYHGIYTMEEKMCPKGAVFLQSSLESVVSSDKGWGQQGGYEMKFALLVCRGQTEASGMQRQLARIGIPGEITRPPRHTRTDSCGWAVRVAAEQAGEAQARLRVLGLAPCRTEYEGDAP